MIPDLAAICGVFDEECDSCSVVDEVCPASEKACGHHCNHSWSHERCCWCGQEWGEESDA